MENEEVDSDLTTERSGWFSGGLMWFFWGGSMSFMAIFSLAVLALLLVSLGLNLYLSWQLAGLEVTVTRKGLAPIDLPVPLATEILAAIPTQTPEAILIPVETPAPAITDAILPSTSVESPLEAQVATLSALTTEVATLRSDSAAPLSSATPPPTIAAPAAAGSSGEIPPAVAIDPTRPDPTASEEDQASSFSAPDSVPTQVPFEALSSANSYTLIPINGERDQRPAAEHGDLNLKLREPEPIEAEVGLIDAGSGVDADAPKLSKVFEPEFTATYAIHDWDWGCNCKGDLIRDDEAILLGIKTTPGDPIFIPPTESDIYDGKYHAVVLYASEDSLTFVYAREGTVAMGYTVHYVGLRTDPNLLKLYQDSKGSELPGLTLDTPVGTATDKLIVAIRDNGKFLDARSINDWWN
jgi:hypothetical protein